MTRHRRVAAAAVGTAAQRVEELEMGALGENTVFVSLAGRYSALTM